ncbi:hypothetical protein JW960_22875 [candidate division KSB1 bacterium]|nr:hypothetical protein [candidate division KSB1 bacterium]
MAHHSQKQHKQLSKEHQTENPATKVNSNFRQLLLMGVSILIIILFFSVPYYHMWLSKRIIPYYKQMPHQLKTMGIEQRLIDRHGYDYLIPRFIHQQLPENGVLLLPPKQYVRRSFAPGNFRWHHIVWNYYFFGKQPLIQFRDAQPEQLIMATYAMVCQSDKVHMAIIESPGQLQQVLASYKSEKDTSTIAATD